MLITALARGLLDLVAPLRCVACDEVVAERLFCASCDASVEPSPSPTALWMYGGAVTIALHRLKFGDRPDLAPRLGHALGTKLLGARVPFEAVVPVPLGPRRLAQRGYDQAALLARSVASVVRARCAHSLVRIRETLPQSTLDRAARSTNIGGAFALRGRVAGRILLVDDVQTTGATLRACADVLRAGGADQVEFAAVAMAEKEAP